MKLNNQSLFQRVFLAATLLSVSLATAEAQGVTCTAAVASLAAMRQEGVSEPAGDILISCAGSPTGAQTGAQTLSLYLAGATLTSRQLYTGTAPSSIPTEAALLINDVPTTATQGFLQNGVLMFSGFTLPNNAAPNNFLVRVTNLRVNANAVQPGTSITGSILATFPIQNQLSLTLGVVQTSLSASVSNTPSYNGCQAPTSANATLTISELVNTAFKSPAVSAANSTPGSWYQNGVNTESQTVLSPTPAGWTNQLTGVVPGQADHATRIRVNLSNIPPGVTVLLPVNVISSSGSGTLIATSGGDLGAFSAVNGAEIPITSSGSVTYEVRTQSPNSLDSFPIPVSISSAPDIGPGTIQISATYAGSVAEAATAIPVFADTSVLTPLATYSGCSNTFHLGFVQQPFRGPVGAAIAPVVVQILDTNGNLVTLSNASITVASTPAGASATVSAMNGTATFTNDLIFGTPGIYALSAITSGLGSGTSTPLLIAGLPATVTLTSVPNPIVFGQSTTLTATVSPSAATGSVTFYDGTTVLGTKPLVSGSATLSTILLPSGLRSLTAIYIGNATYASSTSAVRPQMVTPVLEAGLASPAAYGLGSNARSLAVAVADFNADGNADLVVSNYNAGNVAVLLGNGDGSFRTPVIYSTGGNPESMAVGDFAGNGKTDILVVNYLINCDCSNLVVLLNNGDGTFQPPVTYAAGANPISVAAGDFNGDGKLDIFVGTLTGYNILLGNGDGTFGPPTITTGNSYSYITVGDLNGDGTPDLALVNAISEGVNVLLGNGDGTFRLTGMPSGFGGGGQAFSIALGDFNGDGKLDMVVGNGSNNVSVFLGNGNGTFQNLVSYPAPASEYVTVGDVNGDGYLDIVSSGTSGMNVLLGNGNGTFQAPANYSGVGGGYPAIGEFNGDGRADVAVANLTLNTVSVLLGVAPQLKFTPQPAGGAAGALLPSVVVQIQDSNGNVLTSSTASVTLTSTPPGINATVNAVNGVATFRGLILLSSGSYTLTAASTGLAPVTSASFTITTLAMGGSKVGLVRQNIFDFDSNGNGNGPAPVDPVDRVDSFAPPGGVLAGDQPVVGDWTGDGKTKAGWFRPSTGQWWLDAANTGVYSVGGSYTYQFAGGPQDVAIIGDWAGLGKSAIGVVRSGFLWILDLNADGVFEPPTSGTPITGDAVFAFGGSGDAPVVGNWYSKTSAGGFPISQAGIVRTYCNPTCTGGPFLWLLDNGVAGIPTNVTPQTGHAVGNLPGLAFGGGTGDIPVTGDWYNTGVIQFGDFSAGFLWVLDGATPLAAQNGHFVGFSFAYGGIGGDKPIVGKW